MKYGNSRLTLSLFLTLAYASVVQSTTAEARIQDQFQHNGGFHDGIFDSPLNDFRRFTTTATSSYTLQGLRFNGSVQPEENPFVPSSWPSWGRDLFARVTHERTATRTDIRLGYGTEWIQSDGTNPIAPAPAAFNDTSYEMAGLRVQPGDRFSVELWDAFDDMPGADAIWSNLTWQLTDDVVPKLGPVAPGRVRVDAFGADSFPTLNASLDPLPGASFWGVEFGAGGTATPPSITSIVFDTQDVGQVWWQNSSAVGQFVVGESDGINVLPTLTNGRVIHGLEDPVQDDNFQTLELRFNQGDFGPGDSLRFGNDIDSFAVAAPPFVADIFSSGADFTRYGPGIRVVVTFDNGTVAQGLLNQSAPGESMRSYVELAIPGFTAAEADFDGDGDVDGQDFLIWQDNFNTASGATHDQGDADGNGRVNGADFLIWQAEFSTGRSSSGNSAIPEPTAVAATWTSILVMLAAFTRRRRGQIH